MPLLITRIILTVVVLAVAYFALEKVWTKRIDALALFKGPSEIIPTEDRTFSVSHTWTVNRADAVVIWFVQDNRVTPIYASMFVHFTNLKTVPLMILSHWIEHERPDGTWEPASLPYGAEGKLYNGVDRKNVTEVQYVTFDAAVQNKNIGPNETVLGWLLVTKRLQGRLRLTVKDSLGKEATEIVSSVASGGWPAQPLLLTTTNNHADISVLPLSVK